MLVRTAKVILKKIPFLNSFMHAAPNTSRLQGDFMRVREYCQLLPNTVQEPTFVIVGANDGITEDPVTDIFLADSRWRGVLIEPVPYCFQRLAAAFGDSRRFALEQVAIGSAPGKANFYYVNQNSVESPNDRPFWFDQIGSFDKTHILRHLGGEFERSIVECSVDVRPLSSILSKHNIDYPHYLQIDTEGYDYEVVNKLDLAHHAPWAILVEHSHLSEEVKKKMLGFLRANSYRVDSCGTCDYFAIHHQAPQHGLLRDDALAG